MVLKINYFEDRFTIEGDLNKSTILQFHKAFKSAFQNKDQLTLDINSLNRIDRYGVNALAKLHNEALIKGKILRITGLDNPHIFTQLKRTDAA